MTKKRKFVLDGVKNIVGKGRKCLLPAFSPFPKMFSKYIFLRADKFSKWLMKQTDFNLSNVHVVSWDFVDKKKTRCVCETLLPPKRPFIEKCNLDIRP